MFKNRIVADESVKVRSHQSRVGPEFNMVGVLIRRETQRHTQKEKMPT